jgi:hypothetical protein
MVAKKLATKKGVENRCSAVGCEGDVSTDARSSMKNPFRVEEARLYGFVPTGDGKWMVGYGSDASGSYIV